MSKKRLSIEHKSPFVKANDPRVLLQKIWHKEAPSAIPFEKSVVGSIIFLGNECYKPIKWLSHIAFLDPVCKILFKLITRLDADDIRIDLLVLTHHLKKEGLLEQIGGAYALVQLEQGDLKHYAIQDHAKIIHEAHLKREAADMLLKSYVEIWEGKVDIFDERNEIASRLRVMPPTSYFKAKTMNQAIQDGKEAPPMLKIAGHILRTGEITILFAEPGIGKSIFALQLGDNISRGRSSLVDVLENECDSNVLENECDPKKVIFYDFELLEQELYTRYSNDKGEMYEFDNDMFIRMSENDDYRRKSGINIVDFIEENIEVLKPEVVIIDNITWITAESSHDPDIAKNLMERLKRLNKRTGITFLILAHSTKRINRTQAITQADMAGSAHLLRFATNIVAIGRSSVDNKLRYIKQVKQRNGKEVYHEENVILCGIKKDPADKMLRFVSHGTDNEKNHLADWNNTDQQEELLERAAMLRADNNMGWLAIKENIGWKGSKNTLKKKCEQFAMNNLQWELAPDGDIRRAAQILKVGDKKIVLEQTPAVNDKVTVFTASMPIEKSAETGKSTN